MSRRAFLHVGSPKTGTTFLQTVTWHSRDDLEKAGVRLPGPSHHKHFQAALDVRGTPQRALFPERTEGAWRSLMAAARGWPRDLLISHELLASAPQKRASAAIGDLVELGYEPHVVLTARDLARQLPAEWQERIKHRSWIKFDRFMAAARDPESRVSRRLWAAQDYADILQRWAGALPPEQVHVVTVPPSGAPRALLWERFADVLGLEATAFSLDVPRENTSLGLEQAVLLQQVNRRLGDRVTLPGPYTEVGKRLLAHRVLGVRSGTPLVLGGDDLAFARQRSAGIVEALRAQGVTVHGDLAELLVRDDGGQPPISSAREAVDDGVLLDESLDAMADLLAVYAERIEASREDAMQLKEELQQARADLRKSQRQTAELEQQLVPLHAKAARAAKTRARAVKTRARAASDRVKQVRRRRRPRVYFLAFNGGGIGGVARTTLTVASALAERYEVEVLSVYRSRVKPTFELDPRVKLTYLVPVKPRRNAVYPPHLRELASQPSVLSEVANYTAASDAAMRTAFASMRDGDILISTRPSLHPSSLVLAPDKRLIPDRLGPPELPHPLRRPWLGRSINRSTARSLTWTRWSSSPRPMLPTTAIAIPKRACRSSATPYQWMPATERGRDREKVVMAAGRLTEAKAFDRLVEAWTLLQEEFPDWTCRIFGAGHLEGALRAQSKLLALRSSSGYTQDMPAELVDAIFALSSRVEGFGMVLIEAMAEGTPLVSFDCPRGPGEIVVDGSNGFLVPDGDVPGLAKALAALMRDRELRDRMGEQALVDVRQYEIGNIADAWTSLIESLLQERRG